MLQGVFFLLLPHLFKVGSHLALSLLLSLLLDLLHPVYGLEVVTGRYNRSWCWWGFFYHLELLNLSQESTNLSSSSAFPLSSEPIVMLLFSPPTV